MKELFFIGIDIGGTRTKSGLVNLATGEVIDCVVQPTEKKEAAAFLTQTGITINQLKEAAAKRGGTVSGIGIGVPGFTTKGGMVQTTYGSLEFMETFPIKAIVEKEFSLPCLVENDARTVSLGEALYGKGAGFERVLTLTLGTGVGFGFIVNKKFVETAPLSHMGGHITLTSEGGDCYCGKSGCLEALVSSAGMASLATEAGFNDGTSAEAIFTAATNGDNLAKAVIEKLIHYLHAAIHNYANLFAPDVIVLGGGIARGLLPYLEKIKGQKYMGPYPGYDFQLTVSALEEQAGMLGSAGLFLSLHHKTNSL